MWNEVWFTKNTMSYGFGHYMVNHIKEDSLSGKSESLDLSDLCFVDIEKTFTTVYHPYGLRTTRCCF